MAVGAGFASGREVTDFFLVFGPDWDKGLLFGGILFFITACAISYIVRKHNIKDYPEFLSVVLGGVPAVFTQWVAGLFFIMMFYAMVSAAGAAAGQFFNMPYMYGTAFFIIVCAVILLKGIKAIEDISVMLVPFLMAGIIFISLFSKGDGQALDVCGRGSVYISAVIYVSYNIIAAPAIIISSQKSKSVFEDMAIGILCGAALTVMGIAVGKAIISSPQTVKLDFPLAGAAAMSKQGFKYCYMAVFLTAVLTTALCNGTAGADFLCDKICLKRKTAVVILILTAFPMSLISFSAFVSKIYPVFGFAGILQLVGTVVFLLRKTKN